MSAKIDMLVHSQVHTLKPEENMKKNALVVGLGFAGSILARKLAEAGFYVLAFEKRTHYAGNMYEYTRTNGVRVHMYGPHIFHTNSKPVYEYISRFSEFYPYTHRVLGKINGKLVPIPFNYTSIDALFPKDKASLLKHKLTDSFPDTSRVSVSVLVSHPDPDISELGRFVYENVFANYSAKQWGVPVEQVDPEVIHRVPVVLGTDDRYFSDQIQMMPINGYTPLFQKLLDHPNIRIILESNISDHLEMCTETRTMTLDGEPFSGPVCYSGPIDSLFHYSLGALPYRSLDMVFEDLPVDYFQSAAVVNYPNEEKYTRITEFKQLTMEVISGHTSILKEYPVPYVVGSRLTPYYPISNKENFDLYNRYLEMSHLFSNLYLCGRLAEYRYYNMDAVIERALSVAAMIVSDSPA